MSDSDQHWARELQRARKSAQNWEICSLEGLLLSFCSKYMGLGFVALLWLTYARGYLRPYKTHILTNETLVKM